MVFLLVVTVWVGGFLAIKLSSLQDTYWPKLFLSFSGAYLMGISFLLLLPIVYSESATSIGLWVMIGFIIQLILEQFSKGIEHGHLHGSPDHQHGFVFSVMIGLCLHAFLEGFPLNSFAHEHHHHHHYLLGVITHKLPAAFALVLFLRSIAISKSTIFICILIFSLMSPLGSLISGLITIDDLTHKRILALVVGLFLHISTTILFEVEQKSGHQPISALKVLAIVAGLATVYFTV